jgi:hypothetical protein
MENKKQAIILSVVAIVTLLSLILGATYAYFQASGNSGSSTNVNVTTYTSDLLTFEIGDDIAVYADQTSFASGKGNATGSTYAKATLVANNKTNEATKNYYVYLNISENTFTYTQNESTPELLLTIKDTSGNEITSITSLTHKTVTDGKGASISGFDITTKSGVITLFDNREITANPTKTEEWNITVTFVNYNANQTGNAGKSFNAKLMIQQESQSNQTLLADYVISQYTGTQGENSLYYHNSSLTNGAGDNSYRYAGASESVNNFVCFGSTTNPCPTDNLYRIIGVFEDKVKLIKYDYATSALLGTNGDYYGTSTPSTSYYKGSLTSIDQYYWNNATKKNTWSESNLNKINLNKNFINNIGSTWANKIATTTWKVGGNTSNNIAKSIPSVAYQNEIVAPVENITYDAKIGLMYVSDYGFAASPSAWTKTLHSYIGNDANGTSIKTINWMYMGVLDWTISLNSDDLYNAFDVLSGGYVDADFVSGNSGVRPSFNLLSSVKYVSGSGSMSDPVRVK